VSLSVFRQGDAIVGTLGPLPLTGQYKAYFSPGGGAVTGTIAFTLSQPFAAGSFGFDDVTQSAPVTRRGQGFTRTFTGSIGQPVYFLVSQTNGGITDATYTVRSPSGAVIWTRTIVGSCLAYGCIPGNSFICTNTAAPCDMGSMATIPPLTEAGTYTVTFIQASRSWNPNAGLGTIDIKGVPPVTGSATVNGPATTLSFSTGPHPMQVGFAASTGQNLRVTVSGTNTPIMGNGTVWVLSPSGVTVATRTYQFSPGGGGGGPSGQVVLNTGVLTESGTYSVVVESNANGGTLNFQVVTN
jgi:hypothetical protein